MILGSYDLCTDDKIVMFNVPICRKSVNEEMFTLWSHRIFLHIGRIPGIPGHCSFDLNAVDDEDILRH